jgi:hypothetical protein
MNNQQYEEFDEITHENRVYKVFWQKTTGYIFVRLKISEGKYGIMVQLGGASTNESGRVVSIAKKMIQTLEYN